ncbi:hypothetical protein SRD87_10505, partial [Clostridioides difficile]
VKITLIIKEKTLIVFNFSMLILLLINLKFIRRRISMEKLKTISVFSLIISVILTIGGIGIVTYYVDNLFIRGLSVFVLIMSSSFVSTTVRLIFEESKRYKF